MFNGGTTGTIVDINFNSSFPEPVLYDWLPVSWKKYMSGEIYDKKLKLYVGEDITKSNLLSPFNLEINENTLKELEVNLSGLIIKEKAKRHSNRFLVLKLIKNRTLWLQGLNVYRRGQLIERFSKSYYMDGAAPHNDHNNLLVKLT